VLRRAADSAAVELLDQIGRSEDEVSRVLAAVFNKAQDATAAEMSNARLRKERGRAPGKKGDALGDQINWEQFLGRVKTSKWPAVWLISKDGDYCRKRGERVILNAALYSDLIEAVPGIRVHCFTELEKGLRDYIKSNPIPDLTLPTAAEADQVNAEQTSLPPLFGWTVPSSSVANYYPTVAVSAIGHSRTPGISSAILLRDPQTGQLNLQGGWSAPMATCSPPASSISVLQPAPSSQRSDDEPRPAGIEDKDD